MGGECSAHGEMRNACKIFVGKPGGNRPLRRSRRRWEDNIKMDLSEIDFAGVDWIRLTQDRDHWRAFVNTIIKPSDFIKCG
jgi:hypothetical protein